MIALSREEIQNCRDIAKMRNTKKEGVEATNNNPNLSNFTIHLYGVIGEFAFSKATGYPMDTSHNPDGGDEGFDFKIKDKTIDVKFSTHGKYLGFQNMKKFKADIAVLVKSVDPKIPLSNLKIVGWCTHQDFMEKAEIKDIGHTRIMALPAKNLRKCNTLKAELEI